MKQSFTIEFFVDQRRVTFIERQQSRSEPWFHTEPVVTHCNMLPRVLIAPNQQNSISMLRALKQVLDILQNNVYDPSTTDEGEQAFHDKLNASIDDIETMLKAIK